MPIHFVIHPRCDEFDQSPTIRKIDFVSTNSDFCKNKHRFGYHPTASKALLCNKFCDVIVDGFRLCTDNTEYGRFVVDVNLYRGQRIRTTKKRSFLLTINRTAR
eukprot:PhM_4_TR9189/c0_g3_i1/m.67794